MKEIRVHKVVIKDISGLDAVTRLKVAELLDLIASGLNIGLPVSRPMPGIAVGTHELRLKDKTGQYRVFYYTKMKDAILVFHFFKKKTQATPNKELKLAVKRLRSMK